MLPRQYASYFILAAILGQPDGLALMPRLDRTVRLQESRPVTRGEERSVLPTFEVVSIKQDLDPKTRFSLQFTANGFSARRCTLRQLVLVAFDLRDDRLLLDATHEKDVFYDIDGKVASRDLAAFSKLSELQQDDMLQQVLAERFHLRSHMIAKELAVYALVVDKGGAKLAHAKPNARGVIERTMQMTGRYTMTGTGWAMADFFEFLSEMSGRYVVDRTGLTGRYDFTLSCAPDPSVDSRDNVPFDGPVIFTALREQLGLALVPSTALLDAVQIDHVEAPTPN